MNIFEKKRPGTPVVRPDDLVVLRIETKNMEILHGRFSQVYGGKPIVLPPRLRKKDKDKPAYLILHFPPQSFAEETFFESKPPEFTSPENHHDTEDTRAQNDDLKMPVRARIANESRLVFTVPNDFDIEYSLASVLESCRNLPLKVTPVAVVPKIPGGINDSIGSAVGSQIIPGISLVVRIPDLVRLSIPDLKERPPIARNAALSSAVVNTLRIGAAGDLATLRRRGLSGDAGLFSLDAALPGLNETKEGVTYKIMMSPGLDSTDPRELSEKMRGILGQYTVPNQQRRPFLPDVTTTSIEMPWHLILSPHSGGRWRHAAYPVFNEKTTHTELWHSRLVTPDEKGNEIEPPYPDEKRTTKAIWALSGEGSEAAINQQNSPVSMRSSWPDDNELPKHDIDRPFRTTLDNSDRHQIVHLSSNFEHPGYVPKQIDTNMMTLSALGGWLDSRGAWEPPNGFSVEEWVHRATMGRDHYVRVVYRGFLFPLGHRVSLVKVSERKFHNKLDGNPAFLRQRLFIVIREKERTFDDDLFTAAKKSTTESFERKFPFSRVKLLTETTPDLDEPNKDHTKVNNSNVSPNKPYGQSMFWPHVGGNPFLFQCAATDLDGRRVFFDLPMIFVENTLAAPNNNGPDYAGAEKYAKDAMKAFNNKYNSAAHDLYNTVNLNWQRVALAQSLKSGDTSVQVERMKFAGFVEDDNLSLRKYSMNLTRPIWAPQVEEITARIGPIAHLSGSQGSHTLTFNAKYLCRGFDNNNRGEVFVDIVEGSGPNLDFSSQGDKSGGFIQPNLKPAALSRIAGPVMSDVNEFINGKMPPGAGFPTDGISGLPMPLLFGCIPLGELIKEVNDVAGSLERVPKFICEAGTKLESFINDQVRLFEFVTDIPAQSASNAKAALDAFIATLDDLYAQAEACTTAQKNGIKTNVNETLQKVKNLISALVINPDAPNLPNWSNFVSRINAADSAVRNLAGAVENLATAANATYGGVFLPAGLKQSILNTVQKLNALLNQLTQFQEFAPSGKDLWKALSEIIGDPANSAALLSDGGMLANALEALKNAIVPFREQLDNAALLDGTPRNAIYAALKAVEETLINDLGMMVELLTGDELTVRFDWNPEIGNWPREGAPLFRANDKKGLLVAVEARIKKNGSSSPKISVNCGLKHFDLVLIATVGSFLELNFEKIEFSVDSAAKMDVDVRFSDIKFLGPLSFVETLRDLIPLDGFSDPPYLDITSKGIDAGYNISLPAITCGVLNIANVSLGAGFTVPFIGQPLSVRFNFCRRDQPFMLTVTVFGGGGFFGITIDPRGVQVLEASLEFGAAVSVNLGVASGSVHVMAGLYFRMEDKTVSLTGYLRMGGNVNVLGLINASIELYLAMTYEGASGKCVGRASLAIGIKIAFFSKTVTISCERKFAGSNGDPTLRQTLGYKPELSLEEELALINKGTDYAWRDYLEAFA